MNIGKVILLGGLIALIGGLVDLYLVTLADRWAVQKVGEIGHLSAALFLFLPKLIFGLLIGMVTELVARRVHGRYLRATVLLGLLVYFIWKFQVVEVWIAPEFFAYTLALGPYFVFFLAFGAVMLFMKRKPAYTP